MSKAILILERIKECDVEDYTCPLWNKDKLRCQYRLNTKSKGRCPLIPVENLKMCGYDFEELLIFAEACRKADIKEEDLHAFIRNIASSYNYIYEKLLEHLDEKINIENK